MNRARRLDLGLVLIVAFVAAAIWAASALAGGSQPASGERDAGPSKGPARVFVQEGDGGAEPRSSDDCPDRGGRGDDGSGGAPDV